MLQLLQRWVRELFLKDKEILSFSSIFPKLSSAETIDTSFKGHRGDKLTTKSYYSVGLGMFFFGSDGAWMSGAGGGWALQWAPLLSGASSEVAVRPALNLARPFRAEAHLDVIASTQSRTGQRASVWWWAGGGWLLLWQKMTSEESTCRASQAERGWLCR